MKTPIVTLLTDFGSADPYVGAMKGAMLRIAPDLHLIDLTHDLPPHDVWAGSYTLAVSAPWYPDGTIHVAVVDPGVGSERRALVARTRRHLYVAPDNGLLTAVFDRETVEAIHVVEDSSLGMAPMHPTFHGRDLFGPVGARLALGLDPAACGDAIDDAIRPYRAPPPRHSEDARVDATVLHVDRFGNVTTNVTPEELGRWFPDTPQPDLALAPGDAPLPWHPSYAFAPPGQLFLLWGSSGYLELALNQDSAARALEVRPGSPPPLHPA